MTRRLAEVVYTEAKTYCRGLEKRKVLALIRDKEWLAWPG